MQRAYELFDAALQRPPEERSGFLAEACGDDAELRAEIESLLHADVSSGEDFLRPPESRSAALRALSCAASDADPLIGQRVGRYEIKAVIAAGGMGTVYEAVQEQPHRPVALKVLKRSVVSAATLRRFEFEVEVLGRLRHPNIAQIYEAGVHGDAPDGVAYFAMEYVPDARPITRYAVDCQLDTRGRLSLMAEVADAVHYGHQRGIIHRDLKPANILVDSAGQPKIIDFGVARSTNADLAVTTLQTEVGSLLGTLQYMSPEQCDADPHEIDTRSDVYSLGVVLYELLVGEPPYEVSGTSVFQAARNIKEGKPRRLSEFNRKLRGDVETIVLKALEKDPEKRYQSASALAEDIGRHLAGEPIHARPLTAWTRAVRWARRNPVLATTSACLCAGALISAATFLTVQLANYRPYELVLVRAPGHELDRGAREARLLSFSGRTLHKWRTERPSAITFGELLSRSGEFDGSSIAVLGFDDAHEYSYGRSLCAFDVGGNLDRPLWERHIETSDLPKRQSGDRALVGEDFAVHRCWMWDVFPERPGKEIVVSFACEYSQRALRIYDLSGKRLYEVWHDGTLASCYWMSGAGLLVFTGDDAEKYWYERGYEVPNRPFPIVVFAIRPEVGLIVNGWLGSEPGEGDVSPVWYRCLLPVDAIDAADGPFELRAPTDAHNPGRFVRLDLTVDSAKGLAVTWVIDENGRKVDGTLGFNDHYRLNQRLPDDDPAKLPDPNAFDLGSLPPIVALPGREGESNLETQEP